MNHKKYKLIKMKGYSPSKNSDTSYSQRVQDFVDMKISPHAYAIFAFLEAILYGIGVLYILLATLAHMTDSAVNDFNDKVITRQCDYSGDDCGQNATLEGRINWKTDQTIIFWIFLSLIGIMVSRTRSIYKKVHNTIVDGVLVLAAWFLLGGFYYINLFIINRSMYLPTYQGNVTIKDGSGIGLSWPPHHHSSPTPATTHSPTAAGTPTPMRHLQFIGDYVSNELTSADDDSIYCHARLGLLIILASPIISLILSVFQQKRNSNKESFSFRELGVVIPAIGYTVTSIASLVFAALLVKESQNTATNMYQVDMVRADVGDFNFPTNYFTVWALNESATCHVDDAFSDINCTVVGFSNFCPVTNSSSTNIDAVHKASIAMLIFEVLALGALLSIWGICQCAKKSAATKVIRILHHFCTLGALAASDYIYLGDLEHSKYPGCQTTGLIHPPGEDSKTSYFIVWVITFQLTRLSYSLLNYDTDLGVNHKKSEYVSQPQLTVKKEDMRHDLEG